LRFNGLGGIWDDHLCLFCAILLLLRLRLRLLCVDALWLWHLKEVILGIICKIRKCLEESLLLGIFGNLANVLVAHERFLHACKVSALPALAHLSFVLAIGHVEGIATSTLPKPTVHDVLVQLVDVFLIVLLVLLTVTLLVGIDKREITVHLRVESSHLTLVDLDISMVNHVLEIFVLFAAVIVTGSSNTGVLVFRLVGLLFDNVLGSTVLLVEVDNSLLLLCALLHSTEGIPVLRRSLNIINVAQVRNGTVKVLFRLGELNSGFTTSALQSASSLLEWRFSNSHHYRFDGRIWRLEASW
jgi:hypothetical protein